MKASLDKLTRSLRECFVSELLRRSRPVCFLPIRWGATPLPAQRCDCTCEDGGEGEGWVRIVSTAPVVAGRPRAGCGVVAWDVRVELGLWRCAPSLGEDGSVPSDAIYDAHASQMHKDVLAIQGVFTCCDWLAQADYVVETISPSGPNGGCVGVIGTAVIRLGGCGC